MLAEHATPTPSQISHLLYTFVLCLRLAFPFPLPSRIMRAMEATNVNAHRPAPCPVFDVDLAPTHAIKHRALAQACRTAARRGLGLRFAVSGGFSPRYYPRFKRMRISQTLRALCFSLSRYRLNRLPLLYAEKSRVHAVSGVHHTLESYVTGVDLLP